MSTHGSLGASPLGRTIQADWQGRRYVPFAAAIALLASLVTLAYYHNQPTVPYDPDSPIYIAVSHDVARGHFFNAVRTPGYPLLLVLISFVAGNGNLVAVSNLQGVLFVLATLGMYGLACVVARRAWLAAAITAPVAASIMLRSYIMPIMTEALALLLLVCLALVLAWFARHPDVRTLWLAMGVLFALGMTRPEWIYFGLLLVCFVLLVAWRKGLFRRFAPHAAAALLLFYGLSGVYLYINATHNDVFGFGANQNVDLLGKVMQYHMQHEAPPQYDALTREVDAFVARGDYDPFHIVVVDPRLQVHRYVLAGTYGRTIILHHPVEFLIDTVPVVFQSLHASDSHQYIIADRPLAGLLQVLDTVGVLFQYSLLLFPFVAAAWWYRLLVLLRRRKPDELTVLMCGLSLMGLYGLAITTLFVYTQYARMNVPYDPLMVVVVWGTIALAARSLVRRHLMSPFRHPATEGTPAPLVGVGATSTRQRE